MNIRRFLLAVLAAAMPAAAAAGEQPQLLGVLEQSGCQYRKGDIQKVRVLFAHTGKKWITLDTAKAAEPYDYSNITWTVAFDGRDLGRLKTVDPGLNDADYIFDVEVDQGYKDHRYPNDRLLDPAPGAAQPLIADKSRQFVGWCGQPVTFRPVVVVSRPNFRDPAKWKPFRPGEAYRETLLAPVAGRIRAPGEPVGRDPLIERCYYDPEKSAELLIAATDIALNKSYRNNAGQQLISVGLAGPRFECPVVQGATPLWFLIEGGQIRYIGDALTLVDAGDYDGDGSADVLFRYGWLDRGGYRLFYGGLGGQADFMMGFAY